MGNLQCSAPTFFITPRRLVIEVKSLVCDTKPIHETIVGPAVDKAFDANGKPTPAALGFAKSKGVAASALKRIENKGKTCVAVQRNVKPAPVKNLIPDWVQEFVTSLSFTKRMWWDASGLRFARPIRSLLCLLDDKPLLFSLGAIKSKPVTRLFQNGLRSEIRVTSASQYFQALRKKGVILDQASRRKKIEKDVAQATKRFKGSSFKQDFLMDEVTFLTENPICVSGPFDADYLDLPREVLVSSLAKSQRLFSVMNAKGKHLPYFIGILDGIVANKPSVIKTIAAILKAKLQDSHFFFKEDLKIYAQGDDGGKRLNDELKHLLFLKGMGSMADKVDRLKKISQSLAKSLGLSRDEGEVLSKAIQVSKVDLLTHMVGEFPELQGISGAYYWRLSSQNIK